MIERPAARFAVPLVVVIAASILVSLLEGVPEELPGVALGSKVLLHVARVSAQFAILVAIISVLREAARGRLPTQLSTTGLSYEVDLEAADAAERLQHQFEELYAQVQRLETIALGDEGRES